MSGISTVFGGTPAPTSFPTPRPTPTMSTPSPTFFSTLSTQPVNGGQALVVGATGLTVVTNSLSTLFGATGTAGFGQLVLGSTTTQTTGAIFGLNGSKRHVTLVNQLHISQ